MVKERIYLNDLHIEHKLWGNELDFYRDELAILEPHLEELANKYTDQELLAAIEQFQNQFLLQKENIHALRKAINAHESGLAAFAIAHPVAIDHRYFGDHKDLREKMERERMLYLRLKGDFFAFMDKWM